MSVALQVVLCVAGMLGYLALMVWWLDRNWSELELQRDELSRAMDELGTVLGEALRPPLERVARELARMTRHCDGG